MNSEAILCLARDMNTYGNRWVAKPMRGHGNVTGADNVVTWSTGYPSRATTAPGRPPSAWAANPSNISISSASKAALPSWRSACSTPNTPVA